MAAERSHTPDERIGAVVSPVVEAAGLHLEDARVARAGSRSTVRITLDLPDDEVGSLDSDRLGDASREISAALDAADVVRGQYTLEVSTPGASRPLTEPRHFRRARTRSVRLTLVDGGTTTGRLRDVVEGADGPVLVLDDGARVPLSDVRKGKVEVELKRLEDEDAGTARDGEEG
ncbi:ribosome maturation factor RimP [Isoptericola sp. CG 20/1183]|uniref:Ribosome maturation factor RimP n=1 Tax=Isoptericola halotolerans TaxID=300560 RepID=A0ABX5EEV2_9MICO|nr:MULTISPECIES: ribosome maturation factor RimP [Isoptericola]MCK0117051.1 ribosome maturation factor RimP [Isoptericola sp. S6320L]PRZ05650.1 ribosome maturation factor RimP [Isoptericola halotolerans]PRZ06218.1 ribosome maturation factor RimP [Isoptericola sp. CG 20/1183]